VVTYRYIDTQAALEQICQQYNQAPLLALDTEFVRERTYHAALGLVQVYDGETLALVDPLAIDDMSPFWSLLDAQHIIKVVHAGSEDFEVFRHYAKVNVSPLFDTQVAAALVGLGASLGYAKLVQEFCEIELDKGESRTNWLARPLSDAQLSYAANDVYYLYQLYTPLLARLKEADKEQVCLQECVRLSVKTSSKPALEKYLDISNAWQLSQEQLSVLQLLAAWRQNEAVKRDLAQGFVVKDSELYLIAKLCPNSLNGLRAIEGIHPMMVKRHGKKVLGLIEEGLSALVLPEKVTRLIDYPKYKQSFKAIKALVEQVANEVEIPKEMIASKKLIHEVLSYHWEKTPDDANQALPVLMTSWRHQLLGDQLAKLLYP